MRLDSQAPLCRWCEYKLRQIDIFFCRGSEKPKERTEGRAKKRSNLILAQKEKCRQRRKEERERIKLQQEEENRKRGEIQVVQEEESPKLDPIEEAMYLSLHVKVKKEHFRSNSKAHKDKSHVFHPKKRKILQPMDTQVKWLPTAIQYVDGEYQPLVSDTKFYHSTGWARLRSQCLKRDRYRCMRCGQPFWGKSKELNAHHIMPRRYGGADVIENLLTLCIPCHDIVEDEIVIKIVEVEAETNPSRIEKSDGGFS